MLLLADACTTVVDAASLADLMAGVSLILSLVVAILFFMVCLRRK